MRGYGPGTFGERIADVYDAWHGTPPEPTLRETVDVLADLAARGPVLELAIGTGRVALPLAKRGLSVQGIDASEAMVAKLREKPGGDAIPVTIGDFADVPVEGAFDLIFLVFNTLFNLTSQEGQVRCFENVAKHLTDRGVFVVEAFVPDIASLNRRSVRTEAVTLDSVVLEASVHDPVSQLVEYQYVVVTEGGVRLHPGAPALRVAQRARPDGTAGRPRAAGTVGRVGPFTVHGIELGARLGLRESGTAYGFRQVASQCPESFGDPVSTNGGAGRRGCGVP